MTSLRVTLAFGSIVSEHRGCLNKHHDSANPSPKIIFLLYFIELASFLFFKALAIVGAGACVPQCTSGG